MKRYIPLNKQTKKQQKAHHATQRNTWGAVRPVTRIVESRKAYNRAGARKECREFSAEAGS